VKIALLTDTHWGIRGDNVKFLDYFKKFYSEHFFPFLERHNIDTVVHLGDLVDRRKYINIYTAKRLKEDFFDQLIARKIDYHQLIGNHDTYLRNTNEVNSFSLIAGSHNFKFYDRATEVSFAGKKILFTPWICEDNYEHAMKMIRDTRATICFGHLELGGFQMYRGLPSHDGMSASVFSKFDLVCSGHYHTRSKSGNVQYLGAACEYTWSDFEDPRGFNVYDTATDELTFVQNPITMFKKVFYDDFNKDMKDVMSLEVESCKDKIVKVVVKNKTNPYWFDNFIEKIENIGVIELQVVEDHLNLSLEDDSDIIDEAESTMSIFNKYIDGLESKMNKTKLRRVILELHDEAMQLQD
jgi:predicted phosphodiesterase